MDAAHVRTESNARRALPCVCRTAPHERLALRRCRHGQSGPLTGAAGGKGHGFAWQAPRDNVCPSEGKSLRGVDFFTRPPGAIDDRPASARRNPTEESLPRLVWACPAPGDEPFQRSAPGVKTAPDADAACNAPACRGSEHDIALPPQAAPSPTLPRQARTIKKLFGDFSGIPRQHASFRIFLRTPFRDTRAATARRLSRHLSLFLRSPWTAFSFLA